MAPVSWSKALTSASDESMENVSSWSGRSCRRARISMRISSLACSSTFWSAALAA